MPPSTASYLSYLLSYQESTEGVPLYPLILAVRWFQSVDPSLGSQQTAAMSRQPTQDQLNAAFAQLGAELSSDGVVLRSQPPELPPGDDAPPLRLGSSRVAGADTEPPVHGSTRRRSASCPPLASAPLSTLSKGGSAHSSRSLAPSEHELSRRLAEQSQRRAEEPSPSRLPAAGSGSGGDAAATNDGGGSGGGSGSGGDVGAGAGGLQRARLLEAPGVGAALDRLWAEVAVQHGGQGKGDNQPPRASIGRDEYLLMHRKMVLALDPTTLPAEATQVGLDHRFMGRLILTLSLALALPLIRT